jgi:hypothetical protein
VVTVTVAGGGGLVVGVEVEVCDVVLSVVEDVVVAFITCVVDELEVLDVVEAVLVVLEGPDCLVNVSKCQCVWKQNLCTHHGCGFHVLRRRSGPGGKDTCDASANDTCSKEKRRDNKHNDKATPAQSAYPSLSFLLAPY